MVCRFGVGLVSRFLVIMVVVVALVAKLFMFFVDSAAGSQQWRRERSSISQSCQPSEVGSCGSMS